MIQRKRGDYIKRPVLIIFEQISDICRADNVLQVIFSRKIKKTSQSPRIFQFVFIFIPAQQAHTQKSFKLFKPGKPVIAFKQDVEKLTYPGISTIVKKLNIIYCPFYFFHQSDKFISA